MKFFGRHTFIKYEVTYSAHIWQVPYSFTVSWQCGWEDAFRSSNHYAQVSSLNHKSENTNSNPESSGYMGGKVTFLVNDFIFLYEALPVPS